MVYLTVILAVTAIVTNFQTCGAFRENRRDFQVGQRPYVSLGRRDGTIAEFVKDAAHPNLPVGLRVYLQNGGLSAALTPTLSINIGAVFRTASASGLPPDTNPHRGQTEPMAFIYRYKNRTGGVGGTANTDSIPPQSEYIHYLPDMFSSEQLKSFENGQRTVLLEGMSQYCDLFGNYSCHQFGLIWYGPPVDAFVEMNQNDCSFLYSYPKTPAPDGGTYVLPCEQPSEREERENAERQELLNQAKVAGKPSPQPTQPH